MEDGSRSLDEEERRLLILLDGVGLLLLGPRGAVAGPVA
jgi:hypothetical protein